MLYSAEIIKSEHMIWITPEIFMKQNFMKATKKEGKDTMSRLLSVVGVVKL